MPTTPRARPRRAVASSMAATWSAPRVMGGSTQAESPEWMPASSMCSITPQTSTWPVVSQRASTSTSTASSRNRSTSTGRWPFWLVPARRWRRPGRRPCRPPWSGRRARRRGGPGPGSRPGRPRQGTVDADRLAPGRGVEPAALNTVQAAPGPRPGRWRRAGCRAAASRPWPARGQLQGGLAAHGHDHPDEVASRGLGPATSARPRGTAARPPKAVGDVVVGRDGLGVAVDHHRLVAGVAQGLHGVDAGRVELDPWPIRLGPTRAPPPGAGRWPGPRSPPRRSSSGTGWRPRTRRHGCRPSGRPARPRGRGRSGSRPRWLTIAASWASEAVALGPPQQARPGRRCPRRPISAPTSTTRAIPSTNQGSIREAAATSSTVRPSRRARSTASSRSARGRRRRPAGPRGRPRRCPAPGRRPGPRPSRPVSSDRHAFWSASGKVRPMAMTSPTDFIQVVSSGSAPGNFSKLNRGTLTTT